MATFFNLKSSSLHYFGMAEKPTTPYSVTPSSYSLEALRAQQNTVEAPSLGKVLAAPSTSQRHMKFMELMNEFSQLQEKNTQIQNSLKHTIKNTLEKTSPLKVQRIEELLEDISSSDEEVETLQKLLEQQHFALLNRLIKQGQSIIEKETEEVKNPSVFIQDLKKCITDLSKSLKIPTWWEGLLSNISVEPTTLLKQITTLFHESLNDLSSATEAGKKTLLIIPPEEEFIHVEHPTSLQEKLVQLQKNLESSSKIGKTLQQQQTDLEAAIAQYIQLEKEINTKKGEVLDYKMH